MDENKVEQSMGVTVQSLLQRTEEQSWPQACLYVVATPIGNLTDMSLRAWQALRRCDVIAAEDTRSTRPLLQAWGVDTPLMAAHRHNEEQAAQQIVAKLEAGQRVALVSDAGAPAVSDPGSRIVRKVREAGFRVLPLPGPSAVITALMATGVTMDENPAFAFAGFVPSKSMARRKWLQQWERFDGPVLMFEGPHRLRATLLDMLEVYGPDKQVSVARELTKRFEQVHTLALGEVEVWLDSDSHHEQGEFVLVVHATVQVAAQAETDIDEVTQQWMRVLLTQLSVKDVVKLAGQASSYKRDALYECALQLKEQSH